jgi:hypothetical protein
MSFASNLNQRLEPFRVIAQETMCEAREAMKLPGSSVKEYHLKKTG